MNVQKYLLHTCVASAALFAVCSAQAAEKTYQFDIPSESLSQALKDFSQASNQQIIFSEDLVRGRSAPAVQGQLTPADALARLLKNSNLTTDRTPSGTVMVREAVQPAEDQPAQKRSLPAADPGPKSSPEQPESALENVIVTATRREESLQKVPIAVTAITGADIARRQILDISTIQQSTPNLTFAPSGDASTSLIAMRGQAPTDNVSTVDPAVGVYIDGVYVARAPGINVALVDVDRVEVLRGPQGTLFGRNTIGGAISITSTKPKNDLEGSVTAGYGNYNSWKLAGVLNFPINDRLAVRLVEQHVERDGFAKSTLTGVDLNAENINYIRGSISFDPSDNWNLLVTADDTYSKNQGQWVTLLAALPSANAAVGTLSGGTATASQYANPFATRVATNMKGPFIFKSWGVGATLTGKAGDINLKSITSYRKIDRFLHNFDQDGTPYLLFQIDNHAFQHQFSEEVQAYSKSFDDKLDWILGGYYFSETGHDYVPAQVNFPTNPNYSITDGIARNSSASVYGQATYAIIDQLSLVAGARYTHDKRGVTLFNRTATPTPDVTLRCNTAGGTLPTCAITPPSKGFGYVPFTVGLNYQPTNDILAYAKMSRGFRAGGFNLRATGALTLEPFGPERVDSYEVGGKVDVAKVLRVNAAVFHSNFTNAQFTVAASAGGAPTLVIKNAAAARINGAEIETTLVLDRLRLGATLGLLDPKFTRLDPAITGLNTKSHFSYTSRTTYALSADYTAPLPVGDLTLHMDYSWRSSFASNPAPPASLLNISPGYGLLNGAATVHVGPHLQVSVWGRNLADKHYVARVTDLTATGFFNAYPGDPRTFGAEVQYSF